MEPKTPEDVYKSHLDNSRTPFGSSQIDSARQNLAASFVNGFVNAGFGQDKLLMEDGNKWLYKNKEHGMLSATASLGLILLWDVDGGLTSIDKYLYSAEDHIKSGALLACGIVNCGVRNEVDPALALLSDYVLHANSTMRIGSILGLGLAYAGSNRSAVIELISAVFTSERTRSGSTMEVMGIAALALGMISVGSCNSEVTETLLQTIMERSESDLKDTYSRFLPLGLGLVYLGRQEAAEAVIAALEVVDEPFKSMATTMVDICAYAGTGNVLKIQSLLHICSEHYETSTASAATTTTTSASASASPVVTDTSSATDPAKKDGVTAAATKEKEERDKDLSGCQAVAVLGIALIAMGEDIGAEMAFRTFGNLVSHHTINY
jgi:26S proteasome regulatory subunit N1